MQSGIYLIVNIINGKVYVGSSKSLKSRRYSHWYRLKRGSHANFHLQNAWNAYGSPSFVFVVVEFCQDGALLLREDWWISLMDSRNPDKGYNLWSAERHDCSPETRLKISEKLKGKPVPVETKAKISMGMMGKRNAAGNQNHRGHFHSPESKARMSVARRGKPGTNRGRVFSREARRNMSEAHKGKTHSLETRRKISETLKRRKADPP
jgi:group I intron endonuclease